MYNVYSDKFKHYTILLYTMISSYSIKNNCNYLYIECNYCIDKSLVSYDELSSQ
jgi:hypothetical protein